MFWKNCSIFHFENSFGKFVKILGIEVQSRKEYWVYLKKNDFNELLEGKEINYALKEYSEEIKEYLVSGKSPIFVDHNNKTPIYKAYVTNAVASSVVFYAMMYLNNMGLTPSQIKSMREKYSLGNLDRLKFTLEDLRESFLNQSAFFLNLYSHMNENDRFETFADNLEQQNKFKEIFRKYNHASDLKKQYNRKIFHIKFECISMRNHYEEEEFHENTGVFTEKKNALTKAQYYMVEMPYLETLGMRVCLHCQYNMLLRVSK